MKNEQIDRVIDHLNRILARPQMFWTDENNAELATTYLHGFRSACFILFNLSDTFLSARNHILEKRGHANTARSTWKELNDKGYDPEQIVKELILIEIETWQEFKDKQ